MDVIESKTASDNDLSLQHLLAELARIDILIRREIYRWKLAGQDPKDDFRGLYISDTTAQTLQELPFGTNWGQAVTLSTDENDRWTDLTAKATQVSEKVREEAGQKNQRLRLDHLTAVFGLDSFDLDALLICLAPTLDLRYEKLYGYLQDDITRKHPRVNLILDLLCEPGSSRLEKLAHFSNEAPLFKYHILEYYIDHGSTKPALLGQPLSVDETIVSWLLGRYEPPLLLQSNVAFNRPQLDTTDRLLAWEKLEQLRAVITEPAVLVFTGPDQIARSAAAHLLSIHLDRPLLKVDLTAATTGQESPFQVVSLAHRDARLTSAILFLEGWDALMNDNNPPADILADLYTTPGIVILSGQKTWLPRDLERNCRIFHCEFPIPSYAQRRELWQYFLNTGTSNLGVNGNHYNLDALAGQFALTSGQIRDAVASAIDELIQKGVPLLNEDLFYAARAHSNPNLSNLARKIEPRYGWNDIVLPNDQFSVLQEMVATIRHRSQVLETWGLGRKLVSSRGVTALFAGPAGTGKTMSAEVMAGELGLDLYKIDLSTIVSKYIGETEKNLERIFSEAESSNAILFFDEADALFGKRSEVRDSHDRYANIEISYLLQRMEAYNGVTILATNLRANLDEAFTRRLQFAVDYPFPEEADRLRIWKTLFPPDVPRGPDVDFVLLARRFKLAGGSIRNVIVSAAYLAASNGGVMTMEHLLHGTRRELQKMGKLIGEEDLLPG